MNPYFKYQQASATSNNKIQQMVFIFDEIIKSLYQAQKAINNNDAEGKHRNLNKVTDVFYAMYYNVNIEGGDNVARCFNNFNISSIQKIQDLSFNNSNKPNIDGIIKVVGSVRNVIQQLKCGFVT
jgi:flagellar biosynthetic protein FliS